MLMNMLAGLLASIVVSVILHFILPLTKNDISIKEIMTVMFSMTVIMILFFLLFKFSLLNFVVGYVGYQLSSAFMTPNKKNVKFYLGAAGVGATATAVMYCLGLS
jgi:hypothetical protein